MTSAVPFDVEFSYVRSTGPALERFLDGLRNKVLWARECTGCGLVVVPARDYCDTCGADLGAWIEAAQTGVVRAVTTIEQEMPLAGVAPPFAFASVRLDGTGTDLIHLASPGLARGDRCRIAWADQRTGSIRDIAGFEAAS